MGVSFEAKGMLIGVGPNPRFEKQMLATLQVEQYDWKTKKNVDVLFKCKVFGNTLAKLETAIGSLVTLTGKITAREHNGAWYFDHEAMEGIIHAPKDSSKKSQQRTQPPQQEGEDDDNITF